MFCVSHSLVLCHSELHDLERDFLEPMRAKKVSKEKAETAVVAALKEIAELTRPTQEEEEEEGETFPEIADTPGRKAEEAAALPPDVPSIPQPEEEEVSNKKAHDMDDEDMMELFGLNTSDVAGGIVSDEDE